MAIRYRQEGESIGGWNPAFGKTRDNDVLSPSQKWVQGNLSDQVLRNLGYSADVYEGDISPGISGLQQSGFDQVSQLNSGRIDDRSAIEGLLSGRGDPEGVRQFYENAIVPQANQDFQDQLRNVDQRYGSTWGTSGAQPRAVAEATSRYGTGLASTLGNLVFNDRQAAQDRIGVGIGANNARDATRLGFADQAMRAGGVQRGIAGQDSLEDYNKWQAAQDYNNPWLGFLGTALGTQSFAPGGNNNMSTTGQVLSGLGGLFGGLTSFAGGF